MNLQIKKIATLTGHSGSIYALDKGLTTTTFFSGSSDTFVALWNLETMQAEKFAAQFPAIIYAICHIPEKKIVEYKEALIFAYLGYLKINNQPNALSSVTFANIDSVGGCIY